MQYVRNISNTAMATWNSLNPATMSGAIDVIVVEQEDGTLACSPFHVRFGKWSSLRPFEKKVEFKVNGIKQDYPMKLGEGGEAFFVFETTGHVPQSMQTSPLVSPASSPPLNPQGLSTVGNDPEPLELGSEPSGKPRSGTLQRPPNAVLFSSSSQTQNGLLTPLSSSSDLDGGRPKSGDWSALRLHSEGALRKSSRQPAADDSDTPPASVRSNSPPPLAPKEAIERATVLSRELSARNIPSHITATGDVMLDMAGFKDNEEDAIQAELYARQILSNALGGNYDIGALFGLDEEGNLWIYSSEEAKVAAMKNVATSGSAAMNDAASDPGYQSDSSDATHSPRVPPHRRAESDAGLSIRTPPDSPTPAISLGQTKSYAKTLRLTSDQLKSLNLKPGENSMSFTVNSATIEAYIFLWKHSTPVVISDIDGTITKSDAVGHVMYYLGRDWTHIGVAKLYSDIAANGYSLIYLTSRSVGLSGQTRKYLRGIDQDGYKLPPGATILSPDRTMTALRRELYLRKPHIFKMATLRDIRTLYGPDSCPFYAGFGNRLTDQISYRTVDVPSHRIFTINTNGDVSLDLLSLNKLKLSYVNMTDIVDHYFPPISMLINAKGGGDEYTDFTYWRDDPLELADFSASDSETHDERNPGLQGDDEESVYADDDEDLEDEGEMGDSYISHNSEDEYYPQDGDEGLQASIIEDDEDDEYADDEEEELEEGDEYEKEEEVEKDEDDDGDDKDDNRADIAGSIVGPSSPNVTVEDIGAEIITGVNDLAIARDVQEDPATRTANIGNKTSKF